MGQHDDYGKVILGLATRCRNDAACITSYGDSCAHIDGTVGSSIAVEIESRTGKQVRGAILDLILHAYPKKLLILVPMWIGKYQVQECEFILKRFVDPNDFRVVLLHGTGDNYDIESDVPKIRDALQALGWETSHALAEPSTRPEVESARPTAR